MENLILGRYIPGDSWIHRLDPRTKLTGTMFFILIIFLANNWITYGFLFLVTLIALKLSGLSFSFFLKGLRPLIGLIFLTVLLQVFFTAGPTVYFSWGIFQLTKEGMINGAFIFTRFVLIILMSTLMTLTTMPLSLTDGLEYLMKPLNVIKVPVHEIALMLSIALRFVPTLMDETEKIMNAQRARGTDFGEGSLIQQMKAIVPLLVPLFISSFNRAEELATAMEARGYRGGEGRTKYRILKWETRDSIAMGSLFLVSVALFFLRS